MTTQSVTTTATSGSKLPPPLPPPPLPPLRALTADDMRRAEMMRLWPAPPKAGNAWNARDSLTVRMDQDTRIAQDQLWKEGKLFKFAVGLQRINAIFDRAIENKQKRKLPPPPLPPL